MNGQFVQWGGGNIGRSFIGQVFASNGYRVTFIDVNSSLIETLRETGRYEVETIFYGKSKFLDVTGVTAIDANDADAVSLAITEADLMGVSVGKNVWPHIACPLAKAISARFAMRPGDPLDIILAENIHHGRQFVTELLKPYLPPDFPFDSYVGLIETSIGKMVPIQDSASSMVLRAEPYDELIVDRNGFLNPIPPIRQLHPVSPIGAYVDRKLFIHNMGHACAAFLGFMKNRNVQLISEALKDSLTRETVRRTMMQSMEVLLAMYPQVFDRNSLMAHIDDLLERFGNYSLGDTVFRVGRDLPRKLRFDDRFMGVILAAEERSLNWSLIGEAYVSAFLFRCKGPDNKLFEPDRVLLDLLERTDSSRKLYVASSWDESKFPMELYDRINASFVRLLSNGASMASESNSPPVAGR
jgi:mannitol-1-phosphate 5-dehydrogenase